LKALAVDIQRNLQSPIAELGLPVTVETRTGDTPASRRARQRRGGDDRDQQHRPARVGARALDLATDLRIDQRVVEVGHGPA